MVIVPFLVPAVEVEGGVTVIDVTDGAPFVTVILDPQLTVYPPVAETERFPVKFEPLIVKVLVLNSAPLFTVLQFKLAGSRESDGVGAVTEPDRLTVLDVAPELETVMLPE